LPRTVQRRPKKEYPILRREHVNVELLNGRMYQDFLEFLKFSKSPSYLQVDTIIGKRTDKKFVLTLFDPKSKFQWGYILNRSSISVNNKIYNFFKSIRKYNFQKFNAILTDNGGEFKDLYMIENDQETGENYFKTFYCDPYCSFQKGGCERNHDFFRYIKKKGISFDLITQNEINTFFSNINSYKRKSLNYKTPYEIFKKLYGDLILEETNIFYVDPLKVILK